MRAITRYQSDVVVVVEWRVGATLAARVAAGRSTSARSYHCTRRLSAPHAF